MEPSLVFPRPAGQVRERDCHAYRILVVLTEPKQDEYLREYANALMGYQSAVVKVLRGYIGNGCSASWDCPEMSFDDGAGILASAQAQMNADLAARVIEAADNWPFDMIIADWPKEDDKVAVFARLVRKLDATVVLVRHRGFPYRRILVPTGGGAHALGGVRVANALAKQWSLDVQVLRVVRPEDTFQMAGRNLKFRCRQIRDATRLYLDLADVDMPIKIGLGGDIADEIVCRSRGGDLVVIGGSSQWLMENQASSSISSRVASGVAGTIMMVLTNRGQPSALTDVFWEHTIRVGLHAEDRSAAIELLVDALIERRQVPSGCREEIIAAVMERERAGSTYIGHGTAIPHAALRGFRGLVGMLGVFTNAVSFGKDDLKARFVFLLLTPKESYEVYLPILAKIAGFMNDSENRQQLARAECPKEVVDLLTRAEREWRADGHSIRPPHTNC